MIKYAILGFLLMIISVLSAFSLKANASDIDFVNINVEWLCPQTYQTDLLPRMNLNFRANIVDNKIDDSEFINLLKTAEKDNSAFDFSECAYKTLDTLEKKLLTEFIGKKFYGKEYDYKIAKEIYNKISSLKFKIQKNVNLYSERAKKRGAISLFQPFGIQQISRDNSKEWQSAKVNILNEIDAFCSINRDYSLEYYLDPEIIKGINEIIQYSQFNSRCKSKLSKDFAEIILSALVESDACKNNSNLCLIRKKEILRFIEDLYSMGLASYYFIIKDLTEFDDIAEYLKNYVNAKKHKFECVRLKENEQEVVSGNYSGINGSYILERMENKKLLDGKIVPFYKTYVNIKFVNQDGSDMPEIERLKWESKTQKCYNEIKSKLKGPNGELLEIYLTKSKDIKEKVVKINKSIYEFRSSSGEWWSRESCSTYIHETLHLFGLVDEYPENSNGVKYSKKKESLYKVTDGADYKAYSCRAIGPENSVMRNQDNAYDRKDTILFPAHFRFITEPGCESNLTYYICSQDSYATKREDYGEGCSKLRQKICSDPNKWLN